MDWNYICVLLFSIIFSMTYAIVDMTKNGTNKIQASLSLPKTNQNTSLPKTHTLLKFGR